MNELATYVAVANCSVGAANQTSRCPMLYNSVANTCVSFLPFQVIFTSEWFACTYILCYFQLLIFKTSKIVGCGWHVYLFVGGSYTKDVVDTAVHACQQLWRVGEACWRWEEYQEGLRGKYEVLRGGECWEGVGKFREIVKKFSNDACDMRRAGGLRRKTIVTGGMKKLVRRW